MEIGAHLPLMDFGDHPFTLEHLIRYSETATRLGFVAVAANDHLTFAVPWLDGPTALAAVLAHSGEMSLVTTVALPVVRGPVPLAKSLGAIDRLSGGRLVVGVGPAHRIATTRPSGSTSMNDGPALTKRLRPCGPCGDETDLVSPGASIRPTGSVSNPARRPWTVRLCG